MIENLENWEYFIEEFSNMILPIYEKNEYTFDSYGIHGRRHISRSIIFSEFMSRFFLEINENVDLTAIRYAVSFHDSGRQRNGIDLWENDSAKNCKEYLINKGYNSKYSEYVSSLIEKKNGFSDDNKNIVIDADVLEIMRPLCGHGGIVGFNHNYFNFLKNYDNYQYLRDYLVSDAWNFITYTEDNAQLFNDNNCLYNMIDYLENNKKTFQVLRF